MSDLPAIRTHLMLKRIAVTQCPRKVKRYAVASRTSAAALVRAWAKSCLAFVVKKTALWQVFSECSSFPYQSFIPPSAPQSQSSIIKSWYNRPISRFANNAIGYTPAREVDIVVESNNIRHFSILQNLLYTVRSIST
jgi:hypothetical protein